MSKNGLLAGRRALVTGGGVGHRRGHRAGTRRGGGTRRRHRPDGTRRRRARSAPKRAAARSPLALDVTNADETREVFERGDRRMGRRRRRLRQCRHLDHEPGGRSHRGRVGCQHGVNAKGVFLTNQAAVRRWLKKRAAGRHRQHGLAGRQDRRAAFWRIIRPASSRLSASPRRWPGRSRSDGIRVNCVCPGFVAHRHAGTRGRMGGKLRDMTPAKVRAEYVSLTPLGRIRGAGGRGGCGACSWRATCRAS